VRPRPTFHVVCILVISFAACDSSPVSGKSPAPSSAPPTPSSARDTRVPDIRTPDLEGLDARALIAKLECARCHEIPGIEPVDEQKDCVRCHQQIHAGTFAAKRVHLDRWKQRITSLRWVPSLAAADRLRRSWVQAFLLAPHDIRPGLVAEMPRLAITADEAARLAAYITRDPANAAPVVDTGSETHAMPDGARRDDVARGEQLYRSLACERCHRFTGSSVDDASLHEQGRGQIGALDGAWALAPDLRFARERMTTASIAQWIESPRGAMPTLGISADSARALAAFIARADIADEKRPEVPQRLPLLQRAVVYAEVEARVFRKVCWHCHAIPDYARGDGGPGNSGGFGFAPRGLDLATYEGVASGSFDERGERRSVFGKLADGTPRIVAHLMARYVEEAGGVVDGVRGMPLGLPPVSLEDVQLVESWIAHGRPR
jgi:cytochrome c2